MPSVTVEAAGTYRGIGIHDPPCREPLIATGRNSNPLQAMMPRVNPSVVGIARAGVVTVPPIRASGNLSLVIQPRAPAITIPITIVAGPPTTDSNCHESVVEVIVEAVVVGEVIVVEMIVIVAMPIVAMPSTMSTIPGNVTTAAMPTAASEVGTAHVASMPTAASKASATHVASTKVAAAHVASPKVASTAKMTSSTEMTTTAVAGICHDGGKKQAACEGSYCGYTYSHD